MINSKLISLNMAEVKAEDKIIPAESLLRKLRVLNIEDQDALSSFIKEVRQAGFPFTKLTIKRMINDGSLKKLLILIKNETRLELERRSRLKAVEKQIKMIEIPNSSSQIMENEVTVDLFKQVMQGHIIRGRKARALQEILKNPSNAGNGLTFVSLFDARVFMKQLSDLTGRNFRFPTKDELIATRDRLLGNNYIWLENISPTGGYCFTYSPQLNKFYGDMPYNRSERTAIRLAEDLPAGQANNDEKISKT